MACNMDELQGPRLKANACSCYSQIVVLWDSVNLCGLIQIVSRRNVSTSAKAIVMTRQDVINSTV